MLRKLHHSALRCRESEETRRFYEDFLGVPLAGALRITATATGRATETLHTFYRLGDGSYMAFFEAPDLPFDFKPQHDFDLHLAFEVDAVQLPTMLARCRAIGVEVRGISDHGFVDSIYLRDPNGYVVELCARRAGHDEALDPRRNGARAALEQWTAARSTTPARQAIATTL
ncbi:VOC family protein [Piscinibacter sakaiensis]|uniref:VOC family protein n=1 Tax=Piscinibacter sakaiensis TaxID=1547922 RepID=UPI003AAB0F80